MIMRVQETHFEETLCSKNMQDTAEELEETLSLCDLPLYSDQSADWNQDLSMSSNSTTSSSSHEDYFEFFIQELTPSGAGGLPPENIIFCGKLISTYKHLSPCKTDSSNQAEIKNVQTKHSKNSRWRWKFSSKSTTTLMQGSHRRRYNTKKLGKAKWYLYLFGISRFSPVVELSDIRSRQSRRQCRSPPSSSSSPLPPPVMFGFRNGDECDKVKVSDRGWGLWALIIRALSCGGNHIPATVSTATALRRSD